MYFVLSSLYFLFLRLPDSLSQIHDFPNSLSNPRLPQLSLKSTTIIKSAFSFSNFTVQNFEFDDLGFKELVRSMNGYKEEQQQQGSGKSKSSTLITRDLLGSCSTIDSKELDLDLQVPFGYEKWLDLKPPRYDEKETAKRVAALGISVGLVWTVFGGEVQFIEATSMVGKGDLHLTGQLGDVIK